MIIDYKEFSNLSLEEIEVINTKYNVDFICNDGLVTKLNCEWYNYGI